MASEARPHAGAIGESSAVSVPSESGHALLPLMPAATLSRADHPRGRNATPVGAAPPPRRRVSLRTATGQRRPDGRSADATATGDRHLDGDRRQGTSSRNEPRASTRSDRTPKPGSCRPRVPGRSRRPRSAARTPGLRRYPAYVSLSGAWLEEIVDRSLRRRTPCRAQRARSPRRCRRRSPGARPRPAPGSW